MRGPGGQKWLKNKSRKLLLKELEAETACAAVPYFLQNSWNSDNKSWAKLTTALRAVAGTLATPSLLAITITTTLTADRSWGWRWWWWWCRSRWSGRNGGANGTDSDLGERGLVIALVTGRICVAWSNLAPTVVTVQPRHALVGSWFLIIPCTHREDHSVLQVFHHLTVRPQPITGPLIKSQCAVLVRDVRTIERIEVGPIAWGANIQGWKFNALTVLGVKSVNVIGMELSCHCVRLGRVNLELGAKPIPILVVPMVAVPGARAIAKRIHAATAVITDVVCAL